MKKLLSLLLTALAPALLYAQCDIQVTQTAATSGNPLGVDFTLQNNVTLASNQFNVYYLSYGDGSGIEFSASSPTAMMQHDYPAAGSYTISAVVYLQQYNNPMDSSDITVVCADTLDETIVVEPLPCASSFTAQVTSPINTLPVVVDFVAMPPSGTGVVFNWNFGDGNTTSSSSLITPTHTYTAPGAYVVCLTTSTGSGCTFMSCTTITVTEPCIPCAGINAEIYAQINSGQVNFTGGATGGSGGAGTCLSWDFGDGSVSTACTAYAYHLYMTPGTYTVSLITQTEDVCAGTTYTCTDTVTQDIVITTGGLPVGDIYGSIFVDDSLNIYPDWFTNNPNPQFKVYLIKHDAATNQLIAVDSVLSTGTGLPQNYFFDDPGNNSEEFLVKAQWLNTAGAPSGPLPTYHFDALYWSDAYLASVGSYYNIEMQMGMAPTTGPGFIGGDISLGANKGTNAGVPGVLVFLRNTATNAAQFTYTDNDGNYAFNNVPNGTYAIYPEKVNYATIPATSVTVSGGTASLTDVDFNQDNTQMNIAPRALGIGGVAANVEINAYPNPANGVLNVTINSAQIGTNGRYELSAPNGQVVSAGMLSANGTAAIRTASLAGGIYFLRVAGSAGQGVSRVVVEHR